MSTALCWNSAVLNPVLEYATDYLNDFRRVDFSLKSLFLPCPCLVSLVPNISKMKSVLAVNTDNHFSKLIISLNPIFSLAMMDPTLACSDPFQMLS